MRAAPVWLASAVAVALAVAWRAAGVDPPSFWLDDQWAALVYRDFGWSELRRFRPPIPLGFVLLQRLFAESMPGLQLVPFLAALACIPVVAGTVYRVTRGVGAAAAVALLCAGRSLLAVAAVHPKHYAVDVLVAAVLLALFVPIWTGEPGERVRRGLVAVAAGALGLGLAFTSVFVTVPLAHLAAWRLARRSVWAAVFAYDALLLVAWLGFLAGSGSGAMTGYWSHAFVPLGSGAESFGFLAVALPKALGAALPTPWLALLALPGLGWLLRAPELRGLGLGCLGMVAALVTAALLRIYPFGTGRTDLFLAPVVLLLVGCGLHALVSFVPQRRLRLGVLAVAGLAAVWLGQGRVPYAPDTRDAELIRALDQERRPGEAVLVYPHAAFALAYHGGWAYEPVSWPDYAHGFDVRFEAPEVTLLPGLADYARRPQGLDPALDRLLEGAPDPIHYFATPLFDRTAHRYVLRRLEAAGYRVEARRSSKHAELLRLELRSGRD